MAAKEKSNSDNICLTRVEENRQRSIFLSGKERYYEKVKKTFSAGLPSLLSTLSFYLFHHGPGCNMHASPRGTPAKHRRPNSDLQLLHQAGRWVRNFRSTLAVFRCTRSLALYVLPLDKLGGGNIIVCSFFFTERSRGIPFPFKQDSFLLIQDGKRR